MECGICGSFSHNTLDHMEPSPCDHSITVKETYPKHGDCKRCILCGTIFKYVDNQIIVVGHSYKRCYEFLT